jgi:hypothetical protein
MFGEVSSAARLAAQIRRAYQQQRKWIDISVGTLVPATSLALSYGV